MENQIPIFKYLDAQATMTWGTSNLSMKFSTNMEPDSATYGMLNSNIWLAFR